ncbi:MAG: hypothetical protein JSW54_01890 [Fidelibacterota bacterium]|nr:MAG: hypothetical protein JSW54_01890 [Candidatus Neomarinimicrobiota bacterium]
MTGPEYSQSSTYYRIRIKGGLSKQWSDWFEGLEISSEKGSTMITGPIKDQAALHGILNRIRDLGITLVSVNQVVPNCDAEPAQIGKKRS